MDGSYHLVLLVLVVLGLAHMFVMSLTLSVAVMLLMMEYIRTVGYKGILLLAGALGIMVLLVLFLGWITDLFFIAS